ncbi:GMC oxidoreductase-domain-containing protein [Zopfochytrium polystomum]|nr:GMC oxidoreductase-domain-containing protein [Zopfochytrium polystomum]
MALPPLPAAAGGGVGVRGASPEIAAVMAAVVDVFMPALDNATATAVADGHLARLARAARRSQSSSSSSSSSSSGDNDDREPPAPSRETLLAFLQTSAASFSAEQDILRTLATVLWPLTTSVGTSMSPAARARAVRGLAGGLGLLRPLYKTLASVGKLFPLGVSLHHSRSPPTTTMINPYYAAIDIEALQAAAGGPGHDIELEYDVVVVGSGAGGGVVAAELARAGHSVLVLEKAKYTPPSRLSFQSLDSFAHLFEQSGFLSSADGSMGILAGSAWGGGTYVNWSASLRPPLKVRKEWAKDYGLDYFLSPDYDRALDAVCARIGVTLDGVAHNVSNTLLMEGCKKIGYPCDEVPQNTGGADHRCGFCTYGCPYGEKLGTHQTFLHDAADAGAAFLEGAYVSRVLISPAKPRSAAGSRPRATGVRVLVGGGQDGHPPTEAQATYRLTVLARRAVVSSCGSLSTPALLLRSGLRGPHVGRNLRLHPVSTVTGFFPQHRTRPYEGPILSCVSDVATSVAGGGGGGGSSKSSPSKQLPPAGYGAKLEVTASHPIFYASYLPFRDAADYRRLLLQYPRSASLISLVRDYDSTARVVVDAAGAPQVEFSLGPRDEAAIVEGVVAGGRALAAAGAAEVNTTQDSVPPLVLDDDEEGEGSNDAETRREAKIAAWAARVRAEGVRQLRAAVSCAHQMGSCRMSARADAGAVRPDGETYEVEGLYVADASLFPTASGVNPMVTTLSMAYSVAQFMKQKLAAAGEEAAASARL